MGKYISDEVIESMFSFHPATEKTAPMHETVRTTIKQVAHDFNAILPEGPEKTVVLRKLQEAMMFANSAIAQYGNEM